MQTILILSAGRRVELAKCFKNAALDLGISLKLIGADMSETAPALYFMDQKYIVPRISSPDYVNAILQICQKDNVDLIIPTIDTELLILAETKDYIEANSNARVLVSDLDKIQICRDKIKTYEFLTSNGFLAPKLITDQELETYHYQLPLFIKPLDGSSSINAFKINTEDELHFFKNYISKPIIQEFVEGPEYTVDVFCDFDRNVISITPRRRIATRGGEILKGRIEKDPEIIDSVKQLMNTFGLIGHITVQLIKTSNGIQYIEINPRFGGGAPMSIKAGANSCKYLNRLLNGETLSVMDEAEDGLYFSRFDDCICLDNTLEVKPV